MLEVWGDQVLIKPRQISSLYTFVSPVTITPVSTLSRMSLP